MGVAWAVVFLVVALSIAVHTQECTLTFYESPSLDAIYNVSTSPPLADGQLLCAVLFLNTSTAPYPCYNITIELVRLCMGTHEDLLPYDHNDPGHTGCNTPVSTGIVVSSVLHLWVAPEQQLALYPAELQFFEESPNKVSFCYKTKNIFGYNSVMSVDFSYNATACHDPNPGGNATSEEDDFECATASSTSTSDSGDLVCFPGPCCGCDGIPGSPARIDICGECKIPQGNNGSSLTITGVIRDFNATGTQGGHPDFEYVVAGDRGIVTNTIGWDTKPVYAHGPLGTITTHGPTRFNQWYRNTPGVNVQQPISITLELVPGSTTLYKYSNTSFFPIDNQLFGNQGEPHNYHFTAEWHLEFTYLADGSFLNFTGDDDLWIYINGRLVVDLGGVHAAESTVIDLDQNATQLGLVVNHTYPMDIFFAERHTIKSAFTIYTNIAYSCSCMDECGVCAGNGSTCANATAPPGTTLPPTTPPPTTAAPTTTPPPTTVPPPPPPPTNGTGSCGNHYDVDCPRGAPLVVGMGCTRKPPTDPSLILSVVAFALALVLVGCMLIWCIGRRFVVPFHVSQTVHIKIPADDAERLLSGMTKRQGRR